MKNFHYTSQPRVVFGKEVETETGGLHQRAEGLPSIDRVFCGGSVIKAGLLKRVQESLQRRHFLY